MLVLPSTDEDTPRAETVDDGAALVTTAGTTNDIAEGKTRAAAVAANMNDLDIGMLLLSLRCDTYCFFFIRLVVCESNVQQTKEDLQFQ